MWDVNIMKAKRILLSAGIGLLFLFAVKVYGQQPVVEDENVTSTRVESLEGNVRDLERQYSELKKESKDAQEAAKEARGAEMEARRAYLEAKKALNAEKKALKARENADRQAARAREVRVE
jgi:vacuolar-type H+-ATPase subunit I/STV1